MKQEVIREGLIITLATIILVIVVGVVSHGCSSRPVDIRDYITRVEYPQDHVVCYKSIGSAYLSCVRVDK